MRPRLATIQTAVDACTRKVRPAPMRRASRSRTSRWRWTHDCLHIRNVARRQVRDRDGAIAHARPSGPTVFAAIHPPALVHVIVAVQGGRQQSGADNRRGIDKWSGWTLRHDGNEEE